MPAKVQKLSPSHFRLHCGCGKYYHEISRGPEGDVKFEHFLKERSEDETPEETPKPKVRKQSVGLFDDEE